MSTAIERFVEFHKYLQLTEMYPGRNVLEERLGVSNGYITKTFSKKSAMGSDLLERIIKLFSQLNIMWLLTGEGDMILEEDSILTDSDANDEIIKLHRELEDAYIQLNAAHAEIGRLSMELKSAQQHNLSKKIG